MKVKDYILIGLIALVVFLFMRNGCSEPVVKVKEVRFTDTTYLPGKTDTVYFTRYIEDIQPSIIRDSIPFDSIMDDFGDTSVFYSTYLYPVKDSLLEATITATSQTRPKIDFEYTLKSLHTTDTIQIKDSIYVKEQIITNKLYMGGGFSVQPLMRQMYFGATFAEKRGNLFEAGVTYDFESNSPMVSVGYKKIISFRKK